jgi:hypothetical protein
MDIFLQIWGGTGYLLAKILLAHAEGITNDRKWRIAGWFMYLAGLPAWVILLAGKQNWIAAANEAGGAPALLLGLISAWNSTGTVSRRIDRAIKIFTYCMIAAGVSYSLYYFGGITAASQILEAGVTVGFLLGSYLLAKKQPTGWLFLALMLVSMGTLMFIQDKVILIFQQAISLIFVINGFIRSVRRKKQPAHSTNS